MNGQPKEARAALIVENARKARGAATDGNWCKAAQFLNTMAAVLGKETEEINFGAPHTGCPFPHRCKCICHTISKQ
jgi:hypothetical protein